MDMKSLKAEALVIVEDSVQILKESGSADGSKITERQYNRMRERLRDFEPVADALGNLED